MMLLLLLLLSVLAVKALTLPGAAKGLEFYLAPDWGRFMERPWRALFDAMGQEFFTLSTGVGCMTIFGSYIGKKRTLAADAIWIVAIDLFVAFLAGLIIFPACSSFGTEVTCGPGLIFVALPKVFAGMPGGRGWGFAFFLFLSLAALTTVIAVFECLIGGLVDESRKSRLAVVVGVSVAVSLLAVPTAVFEPVLGWEDFVFSQLWLPVGALFICVFATRECGWGWDKFHAEVVAGEGMRFPPVFRPLMTWMLPALIVAVLAVGLILR
jgi:NSS family neurotransmitter:Na+ symporter